MAETRTITEYVEYQTSYGDTFDSIAFKLYTDELLASEVIKANPDYADVLVFDKPVILQIPVFERLITPDTLPPWRR